jgi:fluoride ion exporter CrcB/FEX
MSAFSVDTMELLQEGNSSTAGIYILLTFSLCPILAWCGWLVGNKYLI